MSAVIFLTPVIIAGWPTIVAAVAGAATALGLVVKQSVEQEVAQQEQSAEQQVEVELENSEVIAQNLAKEKEMVLVKGDLEIRVNRDERGRCKVCVKGKGKTKAELKQIAEQFSQKMTQCFVYNRVATELKNKGFQMVNEEVMEDQSIRIQVRRWVE
jgi:flagellar basal body-associated protein FliL